MKIMRFALGVRFDIRLQKDERVTHEQVWEEIFSVLTTSDVHGMHVYGGMVSSATYETEDPCYICAFTNGSLKEMRHIYRKLAQDAGVCMYLTAMKPFLQSNELEKIDGLTFYGKVQRDGLLVGGDADLFDIRVCKRRGKRSHEAKGLVFLLAPEGIGGVLTSKQIIQRLTIAIRRYFAGSRILPLPITRGEAGTVDALLSACNGLGRTVEVLYRENEKIAAHYAVLRGTVAVIEMPREFTLESETGYSSFGIGQMVHRALDEGLSEIVISNSQSYIGDWGFGCLRALGIKFLDGNGEELLELPHSRIAKVDMELAHARLREAKFLLMSEHDVTNSLVQARQETTDVMNALDAMYTTLHDADPAAHAELGLAPMLCVVLGAKQQPGASTLLEIAEFHKMVRQVSLVITSIGGMDETDSAVVKIGTCCEKYNVPMVRLFTQESSVCTEESQNVEMRRMITSLYLPLIENVPAERVTDMLDALCDRMMRLLKMGSEIKRV